MGVNPVTGGDGAVLIKEIKEGRQKALHDSLTSTPPLLFLPLWLHSPQQQQAGPHWPACLGLPTLLPTAGRERARAGVGHVTDAHETSRWEHLGGSAGLATQERCAAFERAGERRLPYTSPGIPTAGKHVNKSVRYRAALIKFALGLSRGSSLTSLGWLAGSLISVPNPGPFCFQHLPWQGAGLRLLT